MQDDQTTANEYLSILVPCNDATLHVAPAPKPTPTPQLYVGETWTGQWPAGQTTMTLTIQSVQPNGQGGGRFTGSLVFGNDNNPVAVNGTMGTNLSAFSGNDPGFLQVAITQWNITSPQLYIVMSGNFQNEFVAVDGQNAELFGEVISTYDTPFDLKKTS